MREGFGQTRVARGALIIGLASLSLVAGCRSGLETALIRNSAGPMDCPAREVRVAGTGGDRYLVEGCGQRRTFHCVDGHCSRLEVQAEERPTWNDDQVIAALRGVNSAVLACVPEREELELEVHVTRIGRATQWGRSDLPRAQLSCVRGALARVQLGQTMPTGRRVRFVFGGRIVSQAAPPTVPDDAVVPPPPEVPPPLPEDDTTSEPPDTTPEDSGAET
ncbi:MAG: hypothetical protein H6719_16535 [Sandaracinaceae bacterium]|nr:hypothetical protein [Sandaracinaceae bacterium]